MNVPDRDHLIVLLTDGMPNCACPTANPASYRFNLDSAPDAGNWVVHLDDALVAPCTTATCASSYPYSQTTGVVEHQGLSCAAIRDGACHGVWFDTNGTE